VIGSDSLRALVEDEFVRVLAPLRLGSPGGYLVALEPYQGPVLPDPDDPHMLEQLLGRAPAILVTTDDSTFGDAVISRRTVTETIEVALLIVSINFRAGVASARGDATSSDPGAYRILQDVRERLLGAPLAIPCSTRIDPTSIRNVVRGARAVWQFAWQVQMSVAGRDPEENDPPLDSVQSQIHFPEDEGDEANPVITANTELEEPE
jgi:hypothetical protein